MKTIYIFWTEMLNEQRGGIHRVILLLLKHLPSRGFKVNYLYTLDDYHTFHLNNNDGQPETLIKVADLRDYLIENKCDIILGQDASISLTLTSLVKEMQIPKVKFVSEYHSSFLLIYKKLSLNYLKFEFIQSKSLKGRFSICLKFLLYLLWKKYVWKNLAKGFKYTLENSDVNLLLTKREIPTIAPYVNHQTRFVAIPNPLSWESIEDKSILGVKKKEILVVSRIYNPEKRIDIVLKVWKNLQKNQCTDDWILRIVGDGLHRDYLMQMANDMRLKNVVWEGWKDPKPFYKTASIFLMTSCCEGWGLTVTESMQSGVVPVALDTYPALHDIITDGYDGFIVPPMQISKMTEKVMSLIKDKGMREQIALNGLVSCKRFSTDKIMDQWAEMLASV